MIKSVLLLGPGRRRTERFNHVVWRIDHLGRIVTKRLVRPFLAIRPAPLQQNIDTDSQALAEQAGVFFFAQAALETAAQQIFYAVTQKSIHENKLFFKNRKNQRGKGSKNCVK